MTPGGDDHHQNDTPSFQPLREPKTTTTTEKRQRFTSSTQTHRQTLTPPSSSNPLTLYAPSLPTLPFELIVEILLWLPVKFLLQLRCVCKSWKFLISDPQFAKKHLLNSPLNLVLSFMSPSREFILRSYPLPSVFNAVTITATQLRYPLNPGKRFDFIVGSCDGILCFSINQNCVLLWNPSIGKFNKLPSLDYQRSEGSFTVYGFVYDRLADSYKVVAVFCYECDSDGARVYKNHVKVLILGTDSWRRIQEFPSGWVPLDESGKFVVVHLIG